MVTFKIDPSTGVLQAYKNGKYVGPVGTFAEEEDKEKKAEDGHEV